MELMANEMKNRRTTLNIRRLGHIKEVEQEILNIDDNYVTISGRINYKKILNKD
jgi:hypothetical protein